MKRVWFVSVALAIGSLVASENWYDDLGALRPDGNVNEFWDTAGRGFQTNYIFDSSDDPIAVTAWSAVSSTVSTDEHPATFMPRWYTEGESAATTLRIQPPPMVLLLR